MNLRVVHIYLLLSLAFAVYTLLIYLGAGNPVTDKSSPQAADGKLVWQKYNCQACHQFYGLGGYLGPDLSNVYSRSKGNETALRAIIRSGNRRMPAYALTEKEISDLMAFFRAMDATGKADPRRFQIYPNGMTAHENP